MLLLVCKTPPGDPKYDKANAETLAWLAEHEADLKACDFELRERTCPGWAAYEHEFSSVWGAQQDFINLEHDVVPDMDTLIALANCRESDICSARFEWHMQWTSPPYIDVAKKGKGTCSVRMCDPFPGAFKAGAFAPSSHLQSEEEWAVQAGLGCIRFRSKVMKALTWGCIGPGTGSSMDGRLWTALRAMGRPERIHVHRAPTANGMLKHNHLYCQGKEFW